MFQTEAESDVQIDAESDAKNLGINLKAKLSESCVGRSSLINSKVCHRSRWLHCGRT